MSITVVQVGDELTITGYAVGPTGTRVELTPLTGTVSATGYFNIANPLSPIPTNDPDCGAVRTTSIVITFSGTTLRYVESNQSNYCGLIQVQGTLTR